MSFVTRISLSHKSIVFIIRIKMMLLYPNKCDSKILNFMLILTFAMKLTSHSIFTLSNHLVWIISLEKTESGFSESCRPQVTITTIFYAICHVISIQIESSIPARCDTTNALSYKKKHIFEDFALTSSFY